jgi:hypothetical protein
VPCRASAEQKGSVRCLKESPLREGRAFLTPPLPHTLGSHTRARARSNTIPLRQSDPSVAVFYTPSNVFFARDKTIRLGGV